MSLPGSMRVRILSESLESIGLTPVVSQLMTTYELAAAIVGVTGKNPDRLREIFARGSFVSGASRFLWERLTAEEGEAEALLARFPDPDPLRAFDAELCSAAILHGLPRPLSIQREAGSKRRLLRRHSFWDNLMEIASRTVSYKTYSYKERADVYAGALDQAGQQRVHEAAKLLAWSSYEQQIRRGAVEAIELLVTRPSVK